ncbi:MAG: hypothetical protein AAFY12_14400 [Pseudomonadota bacterium]
MQTRQSYRQLAWSLLQQAKAFKRAGQTDLASALAKRGLMLKSLSWSVQPQLAPIPIQTRPQ